MSHMICIMVYYVVCVVCVCVRSVFHEFIVFCFLLVSVNGDDIEEW